MSLQLPSRPAQYFIDEVLLPEWNASGAGGLDINASPTDSAFVPVATSIDDVGAVYPSLIIQYSNETSGGESTYSFMTQEGAGQNRQGTLIATARAQDSQDGYEGMDAEDATVALIEEVENVCQRQAAAPDTDFQHVGSTRGPDAPDDVEEDPTVRLATTQVSYSWLRTP